MNPREEFRELLARSRTLISAILLLIAAAGHLLVSFGTLFCAIWTVMFRTVRAAVDRMTVRTTAWRADLSVL